MMRFLIAVFVASTLAVAVGADDNLLANPGFDSDLLGWTESASPGAIITAWDVADADGGVGSASVTNVHPSGNNGVGIEQCLPVVEGVTYSWGGTVFIPSGQGSTGNAKFMIHWQADAMCTQNAGYGPIATAAVSGVFDTWQTEGRDDATPPSGVVAARVYVNNLKLDDGGSFEILVDDMYLTSDLVFADGFETGTMSAWGAR